MELHFDEPVEKSTYVGDFDYTVFYFENNQTDKPISIQVQSNDSQPAYLFGTSNRMSNNSRFIHLFYFFPLIFS